MIFGAPIKQLTVIAWLKICTFDVIHGVRIAYSKLRHWESVWFLCYMGCDWYSFEFGYCGVTQKKLKKTPTKMRSNQDLKKRDQHNLTHPLCVFGRKSASPATSWWQVRKRDLANMKGSSLQQRSLLVTLFSTNGTLAMTVLPNQISEWDH